jgi:hypothetical protein
VGLPAYSNHEFNNGRVRVYEYDGASWLQKGAEIQGLGENDRCGWSTAMSSDGSKVLLGVPSHSGTLSNEGQLRIFTFGFVGIPDQGPGIAFKVFPNPATDQIHINFAENHRDVTVNLRDIAGQLISGRSFQNVREIIYGIDAPAGIYFIEIQDENNHSVIQKVVKL